MGRPDSLGVDRLVNALLQKKIKTIQNIKTNKNIYYKKNKDRKKQKQ